MSHQSSRTPHHLLWWPPLAHLPGDSRSSALSLSFMKPLSEKKAAGKLRL